MKDQRPVEQAEAPCPGPSRDWPSDGGADTDNDTGTLDAWDPHMGLKPSVLDDCGLDADIELEDDLPYGAEGEVSAVMVDMMVDLDDCDAWDINWLPPREQRKLAAKKDFRRYGRLKTKTEK